MDKLLVSHLPQINICISSVEIAWLSNFSSLLWGTIRYGDRLRAVVDVGFSTAENN